MRSFFDMRLGTSSLAVLVLLGGLAAQQASWPQWRGPDRNGISTEKNWTSAGEGEVLWEKTVGLGYSSKTVADGRLYTIGHDVESEKDTVFCLDAKTGKEIWSHVFPSKTMAMAHRGGSLSTPSIDGKNLFVLNREGNFFCFDAAKGKVKWKKQVRDAYKLTLPTWGFSAAPLILEDMVILNVGRVLAYNRKGKLLWQTEDYGHCYSTPIDFSSGGRDCLAVFSGKGLAILDRKKGKEIASSAWKTRYDVNAATPVLLDEGRIFISSGYNHGCAMLRFDGKKLETVWESKEMRNQMSGSIAYEGHLYGIDEGTLKCLELDGDVAWKARGFGKGAMLIADGKLILMTKRGELVIAEANPEEFKELSRQKVLDGGRYWTTPVLCNGLIYVRNSNGDIACVDRRKN